MGGHQEVQPCQSPGAAEDTFRHNTVSASQEGLQCSVAGGHGAPLGVFIPNSTVLMEMGPCLMISKLKDPRKVTSNLKTLFSRLTRVTTQVQ